MNSIVVTGAGGFIGRALTRNLLNHGYIVYAITKKPDDFLDLKSGNLIPIKCEFKNYSNLAKQIGLEVDFFIHLAWQGTSGAERNDASIQGENIKSTIIAMEQANILKCNKFVFAGTYFQYRLNRRGFDNEYQRDSIYGVAKQCCSDLLKVIALNYDMNYCSFLFPTVYGPGDSFQRTPNQFIWAMLNDKPLNLISGEQYHDWIYVEDAVEAVRRIAEDGINGKSYYVGHRTPTSFRNILIDVKNILHSSSELKFGTYSDNSFVDYDRINCEAIYQDIGWTPDISFHDSILKTAQWIRSVI